jgi:hypothetical protein
VRGEAVSDGRGVVHRVQRGPEPFTTMAGGLPGRAWCGVLFYASELGPESCTMAGVKHPYAVPMTRTEEPVSCMSCLVRECQ